MRLQPGRWLLRDIGQFVEAPTLTVSSIQQKFVAALVLVTIGLAYVVGRSAVDAYRQWYQEPLGAPLPTSPYTPIQLPATWTPAPQASTPAPPAGPSSAGTKVPACGGPPLMTLLLIGSDTRGTGYTWGLADVIRIARIDFITPRLTVLDFPRDLWVEIPEISDDLNGQDHEKLNQAYLYGNPGDGFGYWDDPSAGPGLLARTLDLNFGARVDHYLAINMRTFVRMVDAVGGIDVSLEHKIAGSDNPHLQAGRHHLNGAEALAVARDRTEGVFSRDDNQNLVLCALYKKINSPGVVTRIPELVDSFRGSVQTDLDPESMRQIACLASRMPIENVTLYGFPEHFFTPARVYDPVFEKSVFIWEADDLLLRNFVLQFADGSLHLDESESDVAETTTYCP